MKIGIFLFIFLLSCKIDNSTFINSEEVKLSKPVLNNSPFYDKEHIFALPYIDDDLHYFLKVNDKPFEKYSTPITFRNNTIAQLYIAGENYINSDTLDLHFFNLMDSKEFSLKGDVPNEKYKGSNGLSGLKNKSKGSLSFSDDEWLGYQQDTITFNLTLQKDAGSHVILSFLEDQSSWIFAPENVELLFSPYNSIKEKRLEDPSFSIEGKRFKFVSIDIPDGVEKLNINIVPLKHIPKWHPGNGQKPWLFIDEILVF